MNKMQVDVTDLCALLQCIGLKIKSVEPSEPPTDLNAKGGNTVTILCNYSGLRVVLDSSSTVCTCPAVREERSSSCWQISSCSNGVFEDNKETGSSLLGTIPHAAMEAMTSELYKIIQFARTHSNEEDISNPRPSLKRCALFEELNVNNETSGLTELNISPFEEGKLETKGKSPPRYRSLDTLTSAKLQDNGFPPPGLLVAKAISEDTLDDLPNKTHFNRKKSLLRQDTYTLKESANSPNVMIRSKTSSPIGRMSETILQDLLNAEKVAADLRNKLAIIVKDVMSDEKQEDCSIVSLDVSKISNSKCEQESKRGKFISSPNLSQFRRNELKPATVKRVDSRSTSQLTPRDKTSRLPSKLKKLSPSMFRKKEEMAGGTGEGVFRKLDEKRTERLQSKIAAPVVRPRLSTGAPASRTPTNTRLSGSGPTSLSSSKKTAYSNVKSTIPKPTFR